MTVAEAARILEVTPATVYLLCREGRLVHRRIGLGRGVIRIDPEQLDEFRRSCAVEVAPREAGQGGRPAQRRPASVRPGGPKPKWDHF